MSKNKLKIIEALKKRGFTDLEQPFELYYHPNDGWYLHCDQRLHVCIGYNTKHVIRATNTGENDNYLN